MQKYQEALGFFYNVLKINPKEIEALVKTGQCLTLLDKHENAIGLFEEALKIDDKNLDAYYFKGITLRELNRNKEAIESFKRLININPHERAWLQIGQTYINQKQSQMAIEALNEALIINPNFIEALELKSGCLYFIGKHNDALKSCERVLELEPNNETALEIKNMCLEKLNSQ